ncbi:MAG: hypothetical protein HYR92_04560 [Burkholderiales bacterium]|nr:hypothetical protein [Burkholderiales bacterium]
MNKKIALLTSADHPQLTLGEVLLPPALRSLGADVHICVWDDPAIAWSEFDAVIVRCPWDYYKKLPTFLRLLDHLETHAVPVLNDVATLRWNLNKNYLFELEQQGSKVISSLRIVPNDARSLAQLMQELGCEEAVIKPVQSAGAWRTLRLQTGQLEAAEQQFDQWRREQDFLLQAFMPEIVNEGEWSLVFFNGVYSHGLLKRAKAGDFRVQSDHGGSVQAMDIPLAIQEQAAAMLNKLERMPCYARVDGVIRDGQLILMELELLEPELFLELDKEAASRFANAIWQKLCAQ